MDLDIPVPVQRLAVGFRGSRSGLAPLTWGQGEIWGLIEHLRPRHHFYNLGRQVPVPPGRSLADVLSAVRALAERYEALRTTVGRDAAGELVQRVPRRGEYPVDVVDAAGSPASALAEEVQAQYVGHGFDDDELPLLVAVVTDGPPVLVVVVASHLAVDRSGIEVATAAFRVLLAGSGRLPPAGWQPLDQALFEATPRGEELARRSARHWRRCLTAIPINPLPPAAPGPWCAADLHSTAMAQAAVTLAARHGSSPAGVLLAVTAALFGTVAGAGTVALQVISGNRFNGRTRDLVGTMTQPGIFVVDLEDATFVTLLRRAFTASVRAYRHAQYPALLIRDVVSAAGQHSGVTLDLRCFFHNRLDPAFIPDLDESTVEHAQLVAATAATSVRTGSVWPSHRRFSVELTGSAVGWQLRMIADPAVVARADVEPMLRGVETLLVRGVAEDFPLTEVSAMTGLTSQVPGQSAAGPTLARR